MYLLFLISAHFNWLIGLLCASRTHSADLNTTAPLVDPLFVIIKTADYIIRQHYDDFDIHSRREHAHTNTQLLHSSPIKDRSKFSWQMINLAQTFILLKEKNLKKTENFVTLWQISTREAKKRTIIAAETTTTTTITSSPSLIFS